MGGLLLMGRREKEGGKVREPTSKGDGRKERRKGGERGRKRRKREFPQSHGE